MTRTSRMVAVTNPGRWGYTVVDVFFGVVLTRRDQRIAVRGDLLRDRDGTLWVFQARQDDRLVVESVVSLD